MNKYVEALDAGKLWVKMASGKWWKARRNGQTQTWKTRPGQFRVPIKLGLRTYGALTYQEQPDEYCISDTDPNEKSK